MIMPNAIIQFILLTTTEEKMKIALTGNPNSGKTTLFNAITGRTEKVGNWAGVTVDMKEAKLKASLSSKEKITVVDLPGAYSLSPFTSEESITREFVKGGDLDVIINVVDASNLNRSLFLATQLAEVGIPMVIALNKSDISERKGIEIDLDKLSKEMGCPVVETVANSVGGSGLKNLIDAAVSVKGKNQLVPFAATSADLADKDAVKAEDKARFDFVNNLIKKVEVRKLSAAQQTAQDKVDAVIAHKWLGIPIFALIMWGIFAISQTYVGPFIAGYFEMFIGLITDGVAGLLGENVSPFLSSLLLDGIIGGVGAVLGFLPLIMVLFFLLALLEDCGYMARVAVIMDRFFKKVGLSGKSIIPMVIGTGCAIPGIAASRTIKDETQRRTTAMLTPFMPCGAKIPVIVLFAGAFFEGASWVSPLMYFVGIGLIIVGALIVRAITGDKSVHSYFIMELPEYKFPSIKMSLLSMLVRAKAFIIKAGTIILVCNAVVHIMQTFDWSFTPVAEGAADTSILASIASPFALILIPLGFGTWQLAAAAITGFIAKENVVGTLAVVYSITNFIDTEELALVGGESQVAATMGLTAVAALAYLMFNLYTPPCFAAIGSMRAEMEEPKWLWAGIGFQLATGYVVAFFVYQIGTLVTTGALGVGFVPGLIAVAAIIAVIVYLIVRKNKKSDLVASVA